METYGVCQTSKKPFGKAITFISDINIFEINYIYIKDFFGSFHYSEVITDYIIFILHDINWVERNIFDLSEGYTPP